MGAIFLNCSRMLGYSPFASTASNISRFVHRWAVLGCPWAHKVDEIARLALLPVAPVAPPANAGKLPELGHALATGMSLAVSQAVFEQPPHQRTVEPGKGVPIDRTTSGLYSVNTFSCILFHLYVKSRCQIETHWLL